MQIRITTTANGKKQVEHIVDRFNGKASSPRKGVVIASISDDSQKAFKVALENAIGVYGYYDV